MNKFIKKAKYSLSGEKGMPTSEAVGLIAVALALYTIFTLFKDQISAWVVTAGTTISNFSLSN